MRRPPRPAGYHYDEPTMVVRADGRRACRWCKGPVLPPNRNWCGDPRCREEWSLRVGGQSSCRWLCENRDRGVCSLCHLDTRGARRLFDMACDPLRLALKAAGTRYWKEVEALLLESEVLNTLADSFPLPIKPLVRGRHLWEADHVTPIVEGGSWFDPANLRTLCLVCHRRVTRELAGRRAAKSRP